MTVLSTLAALFSSGPNWGQSVFRFEFTRLQTDYRECRPPLDAAVADAVERVDRSIRDLPDRVIAATALAWHMPLVSRDRKIRGSQIETIW